MCLSCQKPKESFALDSNESWVCVDCFFKGAPLSVEWKPKTDWAAIAEDLVASAPIEILKEGAPYNILGQGGVDSIGY